MAATLYGRSTELDEIVGAFEHVRRGSASTFALVGEPGIGKTRLAEEVATRATEAGFTACWGRAWEAGGAPPYWPWRNLFDAMPGVARDGALGALWGRRAAATDADAARFELFDAVAAALRSASARGPLVCVLDDLHAADLPSLELTAFVARHLRSHPILWLLTWRDAEAASGAGKDNIAAIARNARTLALRRLSAGETRALVGNDDTADALFQATAGNPLFIVETLACLRAQGMTQLEQIPVAEGVAAVVRARAASLSPPAQRSLEAASLLGRDVTLERWVVAAEMPAEVLVALAAEIAASGLLVERQRTQWSFTHDVVREAIGRSVAVDVARAVHRRMALALQQPRERLHHGLAALPAVDASDVVRWALEASEESRAQCAYEEALAMLQRTMAAIGTPRAADRRLSLALARAHLDLGEVTTARAALQGAMDAARVFGDARTFALAVLAYGSRYVLGDIHDDLVRMIDEAVAMLPADERALRARLFARKAAALTPGPDPASVLVMARDAFAMVADSTDDAARLDVCVGVGSAFGDFAHPRERMVVNDDLVRLARSLGDRALELRGLSRLVTDHVEAGDFRRADTLLRERDELARALKQPRFGWMEPLFRSMRAMPAGDFATCMAAVAEADERGRESGDANASRCVAVHRHWLYLLRDDVDALVAHEPRVLDALRSMPALVSAVVRASIRFRAGDAEAARAEVAAFTSQVTGGAVNTMATAAEVVAAVGPRELAQSLVKRLATHADTYAVWGLFGLTCGLPIATTLGNLEAACGEPAQATAYFEDAIDRTTIAGARALRAWTRYLYGRALVGALARPDEGAAQLEAAASEATALGMGCLPQRCSDALAQPRSVRRVEPVVPSLAWSLTRAGTAWRIERDGKNVLMPALRGLPMIARLVAMPDTEIHSLELVAGATGHDSGDAGEALDEHARATYRKRVAELAEQIEDAEARGDADRAEAARTEVEALRQELSRAVGLGGRVRRTGAAAERARISAQRRIKEAIKKIREQDPELGDHLDRTIQTGTFCIYVPSRRKRT